MSDTITITVENESVKYDTSFPVQELVFWLEAVKNLAIDQALGADS